MSIPTRRILDPIFGEPSLAAVNNSDANWIRGVVSPLDQKSPTGWLACLYGGVQTGDDWARINIPVGELFVPDFKSALWSYYMTNAETMGVNMVVWIHDPNDNDKRAEVTQLANVTGIEKGSGWNAHELDTSVTQFFFYGEGTTGTGLTAGTQYTWAQFQADAIFKTWTIYRITLEYGWEASGTFEEAYVADIKLNGQVIRLKPDSGGSGRIAKRHFTVASGDLSGTIAPKTPFRLLSVDIHVSATPNATELFTITKDAGQGALYDTVIFSSDLGGSSLTSLYNIFDGMEMFGADDELDIFHTNSQDDDYGVTLTYQTVFGGE